jgi:hypothetical protein
MDVKLNRHATRTVTETVAVFDAIMEETGRPADVCALLTIAALSRHEPHGAVIANPDDPMDPDNHPRT